MKYFHIFFFPTFLSNYFKKFKSYRALSRKYPNWQLRGFFFKKNHVKQHKNIKYMTNGSKYQINSFRCVFTLLLGFALLKWDKGHNFVATFLENS